MKGSAVRIRASALSKGTLRQAFRFQRAQQTVPRVNGR
jgi:hypothetical protein